MTKKSLNIEYIEKVFLESSQLIKNSSYLSSDIIECADIIIKSLKKGKKIILFGDRKSVV